MSEKNDGGSAFPESYVGADSPHEGIGNGMTLRDYFAAKAMQGMLSATAFDSAWPDPKRISELAYQNADAMLAARER